MTNTIGSCGSTANLVATQASSTQSTRRGGAFEAAAGVLGMSADDIATAVRSGSSLMDLAEQQGVSAEDLLTALEENAPSELQGKADLREIVTKIANEKGGHGPGGPGGPPRVPRRAAF